MNFLRSGLIPLLLCITLTGYAQRPAMSYEVYLNGWFQAFPQNIGQFIIDGPDQTDVVAGKAYRLIQLQRHLSESEKLTLENYGIKFHDYIPNYVWLVSFPTNLDRNLLNGLPIRGIMPLPIESKVRQNLKELPLPEWAIRPNQTIELHILPFPGIIDAQVIASVNGIGGEILPNTENQQWVNVRIAQQDIMTLASLPIIQMVEPVDPPSETENYVARGQHRATALDPGHWGGRHYDGTGVIVGVGDDGVIGPHIDFTGRLDNSSCGGANTGDHSDHVSGTIFGAGNLNPEHRGMAPGVQLYTYLGSSIISALPLDIPSRSIDITNMSLSNGCNAGYTILTQSVDNIIHDNTSLLMVFSAGNEGTGSDCGYGAGSAWGNITGGHKMGKNCLTVGAVTPTDGIASFSSRGPAHDGRIKPEICGKGTNQTSTQDFNRYQTIQGTSMSCPGLAGVSAQLYQAYRDANGGNDPNSGLIKAIIMNNADDLGNPGPDFIYGYGRVNALRSVETIEDARHFRDDLSTGQSDTFSITVGAGAGELRIMTYWHDKEASISASRALINNLDMVVIDPNGNTVLPWVLDETPSPAALNSDAVRGIDDLNNMEQVTFDSVVAGTYTIIVNGFSVPQGPQEYFVTYTEVPVGVQITYPYGGEDIVPGKQERIYWNAVGDYGTFKLEYSTDNGTSWIVIDSTISGSARSATWNVPQMNATGQGWMRISRGAETDMTDLPVTFSKQPANLQVTNSCLSNFTLGWDSVPGAAAYEVSMLGNMYMDSVGTTTGTSFQISGVNSTSSYWVSVRVITADGTYGRRAIAIEKTPGIFMCQEPDDVGISALLQPAPGSGNDCGGASGSLVVQIENYSPSAISNFPVSFSVNGGTVVTETFSGSVPAYDTASYTFSTAPGISGAGIYLVKSWTGNTGDQNHTNDTLLETVEIFNTSIKSIPWTEDFESFTLCSSTPNCGLAVCNLANDWNNGTSGQADDVDWRTDQGGTSTSGTGPSEDHNPGTAGGKYLYLESSTCYNQTGIVVTPCIDLTDATEPVLNFWFHNYGATMGELHVDLSADGVWNQDITPPVIGDWVNKWWERSVDLSLWNGKVVTIRFRGITGSGDQSDMAIDDISIKDDFIGVDPSLQLGVHIWPNPSEGPLRIMFDKATAEQGQIQIMDLNGRVIQTSLFSSGTKTMEINARELPSGVYILHVRSGNQSSKMKWVKF